MKRFAAGKETEAAAEEEVISPNFFPQKNCLFFEKSPDNFFGSLKQRDVVARQVELEGTSGSKESGSGSVVAVRVDRRKVLLVVHHVHHVVDVLFVL